MDQPGSRRTRRDLIIDRPDLQTRKQRMLFGTVTFVGWAVWAYLWLPLVTLLGWFFGVKRFGDVMIMQQGGNKLVGVLGWYAAGAAFLIMALLIWALYNWYRFRGTERRNTPGGGPVGPDEIAKLMRTEARQVRQWQASRWLRVRYSGAGRFAGVDMRPDTGSITPMPRSRLIAALARQEARSAPTQPSGPPKRRAA
jgi:biofilm PGA synthesis protein PgaD